MSKFKAILEWMRNIHFVFWTLPAALGSVIAGMTWDRLLTGLMAGAIVAGVMLLTYAAVYLFARGAPPWLSVTPADPLLDPERVSMEYGFAQVMFQEERSADAALAYLKAIYRLGLVLRRSQPGWWQKKNAAGDSDRTAWAREAGRTLEFLSPVAAARFSERRTLRDQLAEVAKVIEA